MSNLQSIRFRPTPRQREAHQLLKRNRVVLYGGAIRGAKSYWGCLEVILFCFKYPKSRWLMLRKDRVVLERTLLKTFRENFLERGFARFVTSFPHDTLVLTWYNGSQILFMGENYERDPELNRFRGLEINGAFIDELNECREATLDKVIERSGSWFHAKDCPAKILASCNPTNGWVKERFYKRHKAGTLPPGYAYIQAKITDNPYVPADYLESLKLLPLYQYRVFVEGDWDIQLKTGGEFYKCFELDKHVAPLEYNDTLPLHISWDDNVSPYLPCGIFQISGTHLRMIDEIAAVNPRNTIKDVCNEIIRKYPAHNAGMYIYGDATANREDTRLQKGYNFYRLIMDALQQYHPVNRVLASNPSVVMRGNFINTVLQNQIFNVIFTVNETCVHTINDFILLKEAPDGTKLKLLETNPLTKKQYQKTGHFTDLTDYIICSAFAHQFQQWQRGGSAIKVNSGKAVHKHVF
jgi:hypothetical protein